MAIAVSAILTSGFMLARVTFGLAAGWLFAPRPYIHYYNTPSFVSDDRLLTLPAAIIGAPFQWAAIFHKTDLHFEHGAEGLAFYNNSDKQTHHKLPCKVSCAYCHTPIMDEGRNMVLMFPGIIKVEDPEHKKFFDPQ
jgi:hypothetical protein